MRRNDSGQRLGRGPLLAGLSLTETRDDESLLDRHPCFEARHRFSGIEKHDHYEDTTYTIDIEPTARRQRQGMGDSSTAVEVRSLWETASTPAADRSTSIPALVRSDH